MANKFRILLAGMFFLVLSGPHAVRAQQTDIAIRLMPSSWYNSWFEPGFDGGGLTVAYHPILSKVLRVNLSGEFLVLRSRMESLLGVGISKTFWQAEHFRISIEANLLSGVGWYRPAPLYVGGIEAGARFDYYIKRKLTLFAGLSGRLTACPAYRDYGVWMNNSWPVTVGFRF